MAEQNTGPLLLPILGDQLTRDLASLRGRTKDDTVILMMEVWDEATYVKHHKQKIVLIFSAMRHFAAELRDAGWTVDYVELTDPDNAGSFTGEVARAIATPSTPLSWRRAATPMPRPSAAGPRSSCRARTTGKRAWPLRGSAMRARGWTTS